LDLSLYLGILKEGLRLWNTAQATKYLDKVIKLEKEYYEELKRPEDDRSQLFLDERLRELRIISKAFLTSSSEK